MSCLTCSLQLPNYNYCTGTWRGFLVFDDDGDPNFWCLFIRSSLNCCMSPTECDEFERFVLNLVFRAFVCLLLSVGGGVKGNLEYCIHVSLTYLTYDSSKISSPSLLSHSSVRYVVLTIDDDVLAPH